VLTALSDEVSAYTKPDIAEWILSGLVERRNKTPYFAPDYMADIIAEEVGMDYFKVVQALDAEETNACHRAVAALAKAGIVRAVVTTNFDRLLNAAHGVPYGCTPPGSSLNSSRRWKKVPDSTDSSGYSTLRYMVRLKTGMADDSQRLVGRFRNFRTLALLYKHHILFLGFRC
jgi:hypothetical protein